MVVLEYPHEGDWDETRYRGERISEYGMFLLCWARIGNSFLQRIESFVIRRLSERRFYGQSKSSASNASPPESTSAGDDEVPTRWSGSVFTSRIGLGNCLRQSHHDGQGEGEEGGGVECTACYVSYSFKGTSELISVLTYVTNNSDKNKN